MTPFTDPNPTDPYAPELGAPPANDAERHDAATVAKTGTTTVGLVAADGVVVATDRRASLAGRFVANKNVVKVETVHPTAAITLVGSVGGAQSFARSLRAEAKLHETRTGEPMSIHALATLASNFLRGGPFFAIAPLLAGVDVQTSPSRETASDGADADNHVYSLDPAGGRLADDYIVSGSGMQLAYGVLEQHYEPDLALGEATSVAARAVQSAAERDTGSGNGLVLAEITADGVDVEEFDDYDAVV